MIKDKGRGLFIYNNLTTFIKRDLNVLKDTFEVKPLRYGGKKDFPKLLKGIIATDFNLSWFALGHATSAVLLSRIFGKKSVVIAGGWDVVSMPEIGYGAMRSRKRIRKTKYALNHADKVLAVSMSTKKDVMQWVDRDVDVIHLGFDPEEFKPLGNKENLVITVANISKDTIKLKGLETFLKTARILPEYKFAVIGRHSDDSIDYLRSTSPNNVEYPGHLSNNSLLAYYRKAKVYCQLSYQESFGSALAEAMLCQCVPVVTSRGALPEVVGDAGLYVKYGDVKGTVKAIDDAMKMKNGEDARNRIKDRFPIKKRAEAMSIAIKELVR